MSPERASHKASCKDQPLIPPAPGKADGEPYNLNQPAPTLQDLNLEPPYVSRDVILLYLQQLEGGAKSLISRCKTVLCLPSLLPKSPVLGCTPSSGLQTFMHLRSFPTPSIPTPGTLLPPKPSVLLLATLDLISCWQNFQLLWTVSLAAVWNRQPAGAKRRGRRQGWGGELKVSSRVGLNQVLCRENPEPRYALREVSALDPTGGDDRVSIFQGRKPEFMESCDIPQRQQAGPEPPSLKDHHAHFCH